MNTVHIPTSYGAERGPVNTYARMILLAMLLCVAVFACFFAIGRSERPASAAREQLPSSVSTAWAGPAIPVRLRELSVDRGPGGPRLDAARTPDLHQCRLENCASHAARGRLRAAKLPGSRRRDSHRAGLSPPDALTRAP